MSVACMLGFHDWRRRERKIGVRPPDPPGMRPPLPPMREIVEGHVPRRLTPDPIPYMERFEQCRRCDRTRRGWSYVPPEPPAPMPWRDEP